MKALLSIAVILSLAPLVCRAQTRFSAESQNLISRNKTTPTIIGFLSSGNKNVGIFGWFFVNQYWAESYVGPTIRIAPCLQIGTGVGLEQSNNPLRYGGFIGLGNAKYQSLTLLETGGSGFWYRVTVNCPIQKWCGIGAIAEKKLGGGPRFQINIPKNPVQFRIAQLVKNGNQSTYLSVKFNL